jgi:hypothetical protein
MKFLGSEFTQEDFKRVGALGLTAASVYGLYYLATYLKEQNSNPPPSKKMLIDLQPPTPQKSAMRRGSLTEYNLEKPSKSMVIPPPGDRESHKSFMEKARHKSVKMMNEEKSDHKIFLFAVTGGPCAGKTTSLQYLSERFAPKFKVFVVPEMASLTVQAGVSIIPSNFTPASHTGNNFFWGESKKNSVYQGDHEKSDGFRELLL